MIESDVDLSDIGDVYVPTEDGYFVSEKHARIAEIISDYDPTLALAWVPPERREPGDKPFAVVHSPMDCAPYVVCYADDCDERLLARVFSMDTLKNDVWTEIEASRQAAEALKLKKQMEEMEEAHEVAASILRSPKSVYKHNGVKYQ